MKQLELFPARDNGLVTVENNQAVTTSLKVADTKLTIDEIELDSTDKAMGTKIEPTTDGLKL